MASVIIIFPRVSRDVVSSLSQPRFHLVSSTQTAMNRYWIQHMDTHKRALKQELQFHLGPEATVRPFTREVCTRVQSSLPEVVALIECLRTGRGWLPHDESIPGRA